RCFNGAVSLPTRNGRGQPLRCGREPSFNGAVSLPTRNGLLGCPEFDDVPEASMGPCRCRHGMEPRSTAVRAPSCASMGPCRCRHGMEVAHDLREMAAEWLQWGRVVADTEWRSTTASSAVRATCFNG